MKGRILKQPLIWLSLLFCTSLPVSANSLPDFPFVVASGSAERSVKPDTATISIRLLAFHQDSAVALQQVSESSSKLTTILQQLKIPLSALEASDLEKDVKRQRGDNYEDLQILGYEVARSFTLKLRGLEQYPELAAELVALNHLSSLSAEFDSSQRIKLEAELVTAAAKDAATQAERMAQSLGNKIHSVYAMSQASNFGNFFATFGSLDMGIGRAMMRDGGPREMKMFIPQTITIQQGINVVFRLETGK
ncbi:SIMPL domain-containing protein [Rheinheimera sp. 4Y26]|uniref:SIMPL domain-containing protein n=1 Tax=Rheinheimera sp. 4Y26 TaxID=2977811 RepID=UPI0021B141D4|nr:SIMPL domain-containing protein [Rheinheimera sp. 4Y26]MCT6700483.1 SIMPL domain-containing protein [Rheinheimera sp. 4Y26]